jgi:hypothetical protein
MASDLQVRRAGLEPATRCLEGSRSVQTELPALAPIVGASAVGRPGSDQKVTDAVFEQTVVLYSQTL